MKRKKLPLTPRKEPNQERSRETVENIVTATTHILEKDGFEKISTNRIAEKAGVSIGSLYQYFPTKDAIFSFMMERYVKSQTEMVDRIIQERKLSRDLKETVRIIISAIMESKIKQSRFQKMFAEKVLSYAGFESLHKQDEHLIGVFEKYLEPFENEVRKENLDISLYFVIQTVKVLPIAILYQNRIKLADPRVTDELVELCYRYLKK
ncbi:MAG: TetR/AcrR family transcriptional regulator [Bacteriovoracaceae bacterium]